MKYINILIMILLLSSVASASEVVDIIRDNSKARILLDCPGCDVSGGKAEQIETPEGYVTVLEDYTFVCQDDCGLKVKTIDCSSCSSEECCYGLTNEKEIADIKLGKSKFIVSQEGKYAGIIKKISAYNVKDNEVEPFKVNNVNLELTNGMSIEFFEDNPISESSAESLDIDPFENYENALHNFNVILEATTKPEPVKDNSGKIVYTDKNKKIVEKLRTRSRYVQQQPYFPTITICGQEFSDLYAEKIYGAPSTTSNPNNLNNRKVISEAKTKITVTDECKIPEYTISVFSKLPYKESPRLRLNTCGVRYFADQDSQIKNLNCLQSKKMSLINCKNCEGNLNLLFNNNKKVSSYNDLSNSYSLNIPSGSTESIETKGNEHNINLSKEGLMSLTYYTKSKETVHFISSLSISNYDNEYYWVDGGIFDSNKVLDWIKNDEVLAYRTSQTFFLCYNSNQAPSDVCKKTTTKDEELSKFRERLYLTGPITAVLLKEPSVKGLNNNFKVISGKGLRFLLNGGSITKTKDNQDIIYYLSNKFKDFPGYEVIFDKNQVKEISKQGSQSSSVIDLKGTTIRELKIKYSPIIKSILGQGKDVTGGQVVYNDNIFTLEPLSKTDKELMSEPNYVYYLVQYGETMKSIIDKFGPCSCDGNCEKSSENKFIKDLRELNPELDGLTLSASIVTNPGQTLLIKIPTSGSTFKRKDVKSTLSINTCNKANKALISNKISDRIKRSIIKGNNACDSIGGFCTFNNGDYKKSGQVCYENNDPNSYIKGKWTFRRFMCKSRYIIKDGKAIKLSGEDYLRVQCCAPPKKLVKFECRNDNDCQKRYSNAYECINRKCIYNCELDGGCQSTLDEEISSPVNFLNYGSFQLSSVGCRTDNDCPTSERFCHNSVCVECRDDNDCIAGKEFCHLHKCFYNRPD